MELDVVNMFLYVKKCLINPLNHVFSNAADCNHVFIAANPKCFSQEFQDFMMDLNGT